MEIKKVIKEFYDSDMEKELGVVADTETKKIVFYVYDARAKVRWEFESFQAAERNYDCIR